MSWSVEYTYPAEQALADMWTNAPDRADVTAAANRFDQALQSDPLDVGESRGGVTRIAFDRPLAILFDVFVNVRQVVVWDVWRWPPQP